VKIVRSTALDTTALDKAVWRRFVDQHPAGNIFHTPEMFDVFARTVGHSPDLWAAVDGERVLALLPTVQVTLAGGRGPWRFLTTRAIAYGGLLCVPNFQGRDALARLLDAYVEGVGWGPLFTELRHLADVSAIQPVLTGRRFAYEDHLNYLIALDRPLDEVMQGIGRRTRKNIRRGLRKGAVVIEEVRERAGVAACYALLSQTYRVARVPLADRSLFEAAFDVLYPRGMVRFTLARVEDVPVAVSVELLYKDVVYGWYGGVDRAYSAYVPNELLMWSILEWSVEHGYRVYDFGGAGRPDEEYGVRDFKAKFGGELVCYGRNVYIHAPIRLSLGKAGYAAYRALAAWRQRAK